MADTSFESGANFTWHRSYERSAVESFLEAAEAERVRLIAEIASAQQRVEAAEGIVGTPDIEAQIELGSLILAAHRELAQARESNAAAVAKILEEAEAEEAMILAMAHDEVRAIRGGEAAR